MSSALPFVISRSSDEYSGIEYTSTKVTAHGLLRIDEDRLIIQWRATRTTARMGIGYTTEEAHEPVRQVSVALRDLAAAKVVHGWRLFGRAPRLVLTASDLRAFEAVTGPHGLALAHPSRLELQLQRGDADAGREFAAELEMAISDRELRLAEDSGRPSLPRSPEP